MRKYFWLFIYNMSKSVTTIAVHMHSVCTIYVFMTTCVFIYECTLYDEKQQHREIWVVISRINYYLLIHVRKLQCQGLVTSTGVIIVIAGVAIGAGSMARRALTQLPNCLPAFRYGVVEKNLSWLAPRFPPCWEQSVMTASVYNNLMSGYVLIWSAMNMSITNICGGTFFRGKT